MRIVAVIASGLLPLLAIGEIPTSPVAAGMPPQAAGASAELEASAASVQFSFGEWLIVPVRVHLLSSKDTPALHTTLTEDDLTRIFGKVNRVWAQAGIQFRIESIVREEARTLEADAENPMDGLLMRMPAESRAREAFNVYYVKELDVNGFYTRRGMFVKDTASLRPVEGGIDEPIPRVTSHEIGHAFTLRHRQARTNLMASGTNGTILNTAEIRQAREAAARIPWIEAAPALIERAEAAQAAGNEDEARGLWEAIATLPAEGEGIQRARAVLGKE